nr:hypothetical protein [Tanacetum cinerariifolium]
MNFLKNGKLDQVIAIVKSCTLNVIGDLTMILKDLPGTISGTIHHKVIDEGGYGKDITIGAALILANVLVFSLKPSMHYLNITMRNVVKVFRKDTVLGSGSSVGGSRIYIQVDEEALNLALEEEARGGHSIMDPSCDVLSLGALCSWELLLKFHLHACDLGS